MTNEVVEFVRQEVTAAVRRAVTPMAYAAVGAIFALFAVAGLFTALFFWLAPANGPIEAALICAGLALVLAIGAALPLLFKRKRPPRPSTDGVLPQFVTLMAKSTPNPGPRQLIITAAIIGAALLLSARGGKKQDRA
jgi:hypothetical protein